MDPIRLRALLLALTGSLALALAAGVAGAQEPPESETPPAESEPEPPEGDPAPATAPLDKGKIRALRKKIRKQRRKTWHWEKVMGQRTTRTRYAVRRMTSITRLRVVRARWSKRADAARTRARRVPNRGAWLCIHRHEGSWTDPNAPYYGGLQMDITFQRMYGRYLLRKRGTADRWRPVEQMWTAEKARRSGRGFYPWPNTARLCGLI